MKCLDKFNKKMRLSGGSLRDENIKNSQMLLEEIFHDDSSFSKGIYRWELGLKEYEGRETIKIRFYDRKFSNANGVQIKFQTLINEPIEVGDILYNSESDEFLLCTESFNIDNIHWQGKFTLCNWILKWQKKDTGEILEYPCHDINSTQYNSGETSNRNFTVGSSQHMLTLPCDENTVILNTPQRFYVDKNSKDPTSFIVTQNDTTSYSYGKKGLVKVIVMEYANDNENDRPDLGICDYFDPEIIKTDNSFDRYVSKAVISYDTTEIKSGGDAQIFIGKFYDENGEEITDIPVKWYIICDFNDALEIKQFDNQIEIGIDNDEYVDEEFKLVLSDNLGRYTSSLIIQIESLL